MIFRRRGREQAGGGSQPTPILRCAFCSKSQRDVKKLIAGPMVYICDECVEICNEIIREDRVLGPAAAHVFESPPGVEGGILENAPTSVGPIRCKLCDSISAIEFCLPVAGRGWLCRSCLDAVREVLDAADPQT